MKTNVKELNGYLFGTDAEKATFAIRNLNLWGKIDYAECQFIQHRVFDKFERCWSETSLHVEILAKQGAHSWKVSVSFSLHNQPFVSVHYRNTPNGKCNANSFICYWDVEVEDEATFWRKIAYCGANEELLADLMKAIRVTNTDCIPF